MRRMQEIELEGQAIVLGIVVLIAVVYGAAVAKCITWVKSWKKQSR